VQDVSHLQINKSRIDCKLTRSHWVGDSSHVEGNGCVTVYMYIGSQTMLSSVCESET